MIMARGKLRGARGVMRELTVHVLHDRYRVRNLGGPDAREGNPCVFRARFVQRTMHAVRLVVLTMLLLGLAVLMTRSVARALRTGMVTLKGWRDVPPVRHTSVLLDLYGRGRVVAVGVFVAAWWYVMFLQQLSP
jgi:hypothetical protein